MCELFSDRFGGWKMESQQSKDYLFYKFGLYIVSNMWAVISVFRDWAFIIIPIFCILNGSSETLNPELVLLATEKAVKTF